MIDPSWADGIDVSHYRPVADFSAIPPDVAIFAAKATEGETFVDRTVLAHRDGARARGFDLVAYYHVAAPGDGGDHAERLANHIGPLAANECLVLDVERGSRVDVAYAVEFYARLEQLGLRRSFDLVYLSHDVYGLMGGSVWPDAVRKPGLWAPRYKSGGVPPVLPSPWLGIGWRLWQWTDGGATGDRYSCPGVGTCDASKFSGDRDALLTFVAGG